MPELWEAGDNIRKSRVAEAPEAVQALALLATLLGARKLDQAGLIVTETLARDLGASRVSVGFRDRGIHDDCRPAASSAGPIADQPSRDIDAVAAAMDEALDQGATIQLPQPTGALPRITLAHAALTKFGAGAVCTVPMAAAGRYVGAICLEWPANPPEPRIVAAIEHQVCLVAPVLHLHRLNERTAWQRLHDTWCDALDRLRAPKGQGLRLVLASIVIVLFVGLLIPVDDKVGGRARVEGKIQRVLVAPVDGFVKVVHARPGDAVRDGQVLVELADEELSLDHRKWGAELAQYDGAYAAAFARSDRTEMVINQARAEEARAQLALIESRIGRSRLVAPFDGVLIQGDLARTLGAPVRRGDTLVTVAPHDAYRVIVEIDERDIAKLAPGQPGRLAVSALPWDSLPIKVERITPLATAVEGANVFEVEASPGGPTTRLQPGLQGSARIVVGRRALLPNVAERIAARIRMYTWIWWG